MAKQQDNTWLYVAGGAVALYLIARSRRVDTGLDMVAEPTPTPTPTPRPPARRPTYTSEVTYETPAEHVTTDAPAYVVAHPCAFSTTAAHAVYSDPDNVVPTAWLPSGATVTVVEKAVRGGETWFRANMDWDQLSPRVSGSARRPLWFTPNATERARCAG